MTDIGKPVRRRQVVPIRHPIAPTHEPQPPALPTPPVTPVKIPEEEPA